MARNNPDQTTARIERSALAKLKAVAEAMKRSPVMALTVIIEEAYKKYVEKG